MSGQLWTLQVKSLRAAFMSRPQAGQPGAAVQLAGVTSNNLAVSPELLLAAAAAGMCLATSASKRSIQMFVITEKAPTRAFSLLKVDVKLGPRHNYHEGRAAMRHYANQTPVPYDFCVSDPISR